MCTYGISIVDDTTMADGHDFVLIALASGDTWVYYRESTLEAGPLEDSWSAYRELALSAHDGPRRATADPNQLQLVI